MAAPKCKPEMSSVCANSALCHQCDGIKLFRDRSAEAQEKEAKRQARKEEQKSNPIARPKERKQGMDFEKQVTSKYNKTMNKGKKKVNKPRLSLDDMGEPEAEDPPKRSSYRPPIGKSTAAPQQNVARRQKNSGAHWFAKGDIVLPEMLMEAKERGTKNSRGEKTISIPKQWIDDMVVESRKEGKPYWCIPFRYKNDDGIYIVKDYDQELELWYELQEARKEIARLKEAKGES